MVGHALNLGIGCQLLNNAAKHDMLAVIGNEMTGASSSTWSPDFVRYSSTSSSLSSSYLLSLILLAMFARLGSSAARSF